MRDVHRFTIISVLFFSFLFGNSVQPRFPTLNEWGIRSLAALQFFFFCIDGSRSKGPQSPLTIRKTAFRQHGSPLNILKITLYLPPPFKKQTGSVNGYANTVYWWNSNSARLTLIFFFLAKWSETLNLHHQRHLFCKVQERSCFKHQTIFLFLRDLV